MLRRWVLVGSFAALSCSSVRHAVAPDAGARDEPCNGLDDDADGAIDEGCPCTPFEVDVPLAGGIPFLSLTWTGTGYLVTGVASQNGTELWDEVVVAVREDGTIQHSARERGGAGEAAEGDTMAAWNGHQLGMVVPGLAPYELSFQLFDPVTFTFGPRRLLSNDPSFGMCAGVVWSGDHFGIVWDDAYSKDELHVRELDALGQPFGDEHIIGGWTDVAVESLRALPDGYLVGVSGQAATTALRIDRSNGFVARSLPLSIGEGQWLDVVPGPGGFAASYRRPNDGAEMQVYTLDGSPDGPVLYKPGKMWTAALAATNDRYRLTYLAASPYISPDGVTQVTIDGHGTRVDSSRIAASTPQEVGGWPLSTTAAGRTAIAIPMSTPEAPVFGSVELIQRCDAPVR